MMRINYFYLYATGVSCWRSLNRQVTSGLKPRISSCIMQSSDEDSFMKKSISSAICIPEVDSSSARELACKLGVEHDILINSLKVSPDLIKITPLQWENCFKVLIDNGLTIENSLHMVTKYPRLLLTNTENLAIVFQQWRGTKVEEKYILSLLKSQPQFLLLSPQDISFRMAHLKTLGSSKSVVDLLKGAPRIMLDNWKDVSAKLSFLVDEMRIQKKHILKSYALNRSLVFLKTRIIFLERCGKYIKPKLDADPNLPSKNPPLKSIVETNDEHFATKVAGLTLEEYEAFQELYSMELEELNWSDSNSDSE